MACYSQRCDSGYFVESHNDRERQLREQMRDHERFTRMHTQRELGEKLSYLDKCEYGDEILLHMEDMEVTLCAISRFGCCTNCVRLDQNVARCCVD